MSEFHVDVVKLGDVTHHPNADQLDITRVHDGYPCIVKRGDFKKGDLAVYIPIDTVLPEIPCFSFLKDGDRKRLRAKRLRGIFSMGLIIPAESWMHEGMDVASHYGITKYEPPEPASMGGENEPAPVGWHFPHYTDIEGLRKWGNKINPNEEVIITEKIHGANGRYVYDGTRLWVGSRTCIKRHDPNNIWWKVAIQSNLEEKLANMPMHIFFGEVYGQVQDLKYGHSGKNTASFIVFDVFDIKSGRYLDHAEAMYAAKFVGLDWVPILYNGLFSNINPAELAEGNSTLAENVREGFVVKPIKERYDDELGRVILKMHGEGFLTRKGG